MRLRASASIAALWSTPTARAARGASSSSMRPVPVPRSSRLRNGLSPISASERRLDPLLGRMQRADAVPVGGALGEIGGRLLAARLARASSRARSALQRRIGRIEPGDEIARERAARSARRKNAQAPSRWRSASPASTSSFRWRETRGCDWPRMATSSLTVSSRLAEGTACAAASPRPPPRGLRAERKAERRPLYQT